MTRYGYFDMPDGYSDVAYGLVKAVCPTCGQRWDAPAEQAWEGDDGIRYADCMCSELPELIACPFCDNAHPDDTICGCPQERAEVIRVEGLVYCNGWLSPKDSAFLSTYYAFE